MKRLMLISLCISAAFITLPAMGQIITFDENGKGAFDDGRTLDYGIGDAGVDPVPLPTLFYYLPFPVVQGDVAVLEPGTNLVSDVLRFTTDPAINASRVYIYSDMESTDITKDLADVGIPQLGGTNVAIVFERGLEGGLNGVTWVPTGNLPGGSPAGAAPITYNFISDVPEPATVCLLGLGALSLIRRKK
jgi:hypothetical protein